MMLRPAQTVRTNLRSTKRKPQERIVVTGIGIVSPIGTEVATYWRALTEGRCGIRTVTQCPSTDLPCTIAAEVPDFDPTRYIERKEARRLTRASQFAVAAARLALADAELQVTAANAQDIGVLVANGSTSPVEIEATVQAILEEGQLRVNPFQFASSLPNMPACQVSIQLGIQGYTTSIGTACAASSQAIGEAAEVIRRGQATIMIAGGTEASICRLTMICFASLRALSTRNNDPAHASRPFDATRDGFVLGEGAALLVLERLDHAIQRGVRIYAEVVGYGVSSDAYHIVAPEPHGCGASRAIARALDRARVPYEEVDYINAHATSTPTGDIAEVRAIKHVFGERAYDIPVSATKSMTGHLMSASGAIEAATTILAIAHGIIPPTINYTYSDKDCDLDVVPNTYRATPINIAVSNSFGFGGVNSVLVFKKYRAS